MAALKEIGLDTIVVQASGLVAADLDGEKVMLSIEKGQYFSLNGVAGRIWELLEKPLTVREITTELQKEYAVEAETCQEEVLAFLKELYDQGVVDIT